MEYQVTYTSVCSVTSLEEVVCNESVALPGLALKLALLPLQEIYSTVP